MEIINTSQPNDFLGDRLRDAFIKINNNFGELISELENPILIQDINGLANTLNSLQQQINEIQSFDGEPLMYQAGYGISIIGNVISAVDNSFSGDYDDLTNKPFIPSDTNDLTNGAGFITLDDIPSGGNVEWDDVLNKPTIPTDNNQLTNGAGYITLSQVPAGFSGDYNDLTNKPVITPVSSNSISFTNLNIYGSYSNPRTGAITFDLTGAKFGYIQEVYHTGASMPSLPASAKIVNDVEYSNSKVNLLLFKYIDNSRVEVVVNVLEN